MLGETLRIIRIANDKKITQISLETDIPSLTVYNI